jgi:BRCA1-associated protein
VDREKKKGSKSELLARNMSKSLQEEKRVNEGLMKRIEHIGGDNEAVRKQYKELQGEVEELKEMNRDLSMFISGQQKLKELENEGQMEEGELQGGSASVPEKKGRRRKR